MNYPAWVEIKSDEIRTHVIVTPQGPTWPVQFLSFAGKPLHNLERFAKDFAALAASSGILEYDCGFIVENSFNDSYRWVRSSKGLPDDLKDKKAGFLLFDLPTQPGPFVSRVTARHNVTVCAVAMGMPMLQPYGEWANSEEDVDKMFEEARKQGHEGLMVKSMGHLYERGKRSNGWLKVKPEDDADGIIEALEEAVSESGVPLERTGSIRIRVEDGSVATPHGISHELGKDMHNNPDKYIGQWAEFRFMERDRQGGYRHPVFHRIREAKQ